MQQEEQLRALKLEREFQRRAEECARQEEEEEGEEDQVRVIRQDCDPLGFCRGFVTQCVYVICHIAVYFVPSLASEELSLKTAHMLSTVRVHHYLLPVICGCGVLATVGWVALFSST